MFICFNRTQMRMFLGNVDPIRGSRRKSKIFCSVCLFLIRVFVSEPPATTVSDENALRRPYHVCAVARSTFLLRSQGSPALKPSTELTIS